MKMQLGMYQCKIHKFLQLEMGPQFEGSDGPWRHEGFQVQNLHSSGAYGH